MLLRHTLALFVVVAFSVTTALADDDPAGRLVRRGISRDVAQQILARWQDLHPDRSVDAVVSLIARAADEGAPADLVARKAVEGLAKGVPESRLLPALDRWGNRLADAARTARQLRLDLHNEGIDEQEAILRLSVLHRGRHDDAWLARLRDEAKASETDLGGFLRVGEAVSHMTGKLGLDHTDAESLGKLFIRRQVAQEDIGKFLRAIEFSKERSTVAEAAQSIREKILRGMSPDEVLRAAGGVRSQARNGGGNGNGQETRGGRSGEGSQGTGGN